MFSFQIFFTALFPGGHFQSSFLLSRGFLHVVRLIVCDCGLESILVVFVVIVFYPCFCGSRALLVVESLPSVLELVKTTETIESLSQQDLLCKNLKKYAINQRGK